MAYARDERDSWSRERGSPRVVGDLIQGGHRSRRHQQPETPARAAETPERCRSGVRIARAAAKTVRTPHMRRGLHAVARTDQVRSPCGGGSACATGLLSVRREGKMALHSPCSCRPGGRDRACQRRSRRTAGSRLPQQRGVRGCSRDRAESQVGTRDAAAGLLSNGLCRLLSSILVLVPGVGVLRDGAGQGAPTWLTVQDPRPVGV